ncbi:hypothetical protein FRC18_003508, partial [Serendipita sp. 400]
MSSDQIELRSIKNKIIGNPDAKVSLAIGGALARVLQCLNASHAPETRIEALHIVYSLSSGSQEALLQLLNHKAIPSLLDVFSSIDSTSPQRLRAALGRAFKAIVSNITDCCGFQSWGILPSVSRRLWREAQFALEELFQPTALDAWLPHLLDTSLYASICGAISTGVRTPTHRTAICEWRPASDRAKATTSKRGWEKSNTLIISPTTPSSLHFPTSQANQFWVVKHLLHAVFDRQSSLATVTVSLEALASICKDNPAACSYLRMETSSSSTTTDTSNHLQPFLLLLQSSSQDVRIASVHLLANYSKATLNTSLGMSGNTATYVSHLREFGIFNHPFLREGNNAQQDQHPTYSLCLTILHILVGMICAEDESLTVRTKACYVLSRFCTGDRIIAAAAVDCGGIQSLFSALVWETKLHNGKATEGEEMQEEEEEEEEEPVQILQLREAAFTCLATLGLTDSQYSRVIQEMDASREGDPSSSSSSRRKPPSVEAKEPFLFPLLARSILHPHLGVRFSSLQLVRALTRSLAVLRTGLVDTEIPNKVIQVIGRFDKEAETAEKADDTNRPEMDAPEGEDTEHRAVVMAALMSMCNLLNDYAPFREEIVKSGAIKHLVQHTRSRDDDIRLNALWAIRNALCNAKHSEIVEIMDSLGWDHFVHLTDDHDRRVREQSIIILQNITTTNKDLTHTVDALGNQKIVTILQQAMSNNDPRTVENAIRALNNVIAGPEPCRDLILHQRHILSLLKNGLTSAAVGVRCAAANCVCELLARQPFRHRELRDVGMEQALKSVLGGRERSGAYPQHGSHGVPSASGFGAALAASGSFVVTSPVQATGAMGAIGTSGGSTSDAAFPLQDAP